MRRPFPLLFDLRGVYHTRVNDKDGTMSDAPEQPRTELPPAAQRALAEAEERRAQAEAEASDMPTEYGGRIKGLEPVRYGDWEKKGIAIDF